jgi:hypothetical protein
LQISVEALHLFRCLANKLANLRELTQVTADELLAAADEIHLGGNS